MSKAFSKSINATCSVLFRSNLFSVIIFKKNVRSFKLLLILNPYWHSRSFPLIITLFSVFTQLLSHIFYIHLPTARFVVLTFSSIFFLQSDGMSSSLHIKSGSSLGVPMPSYFSQFWKSRYLIRRFHDFSVFQLVLFPLHVSIPILLFLVHLFLFFHILIAFQTSNSLKYFLHLFSTSSLSTRVTFLKYHILLSIFICSWSLLAS